MCGFVAVFSKDGKKIDRTLVQRMSDLIHHRGPDSSSYWENSSVALSFKRLSIFDTSEAGTQPMLSFNGDYVISFNGEVYNFLEIRDELESKGYKFTSGSDTEVVLNSFIEWGEGCVNRFIGMFAFIIVNTKTSEAFVARDHLGIKPLFYTEDNDFLYFASEIKAFKPIKKFSINQNSLYEQLYFRYVYGENTPFEKVFRFPEGSRARIDKGSVRDIHKYYTIYKSLESFDSNNRNVSNEIIETALNDSIKLHTRSDVGYNVQLSGGVDSSYVTAIASELNSHLSTYSIAIPGSDLDESEFQRIVSNKFNTNHHEIKIGFDDFENVLDSATWAMDLPIVHLGCVFLKLLCAESRNDSKVILTGEGADELFAGYSRYNFQKLEKIVFGLLDSGVKESHIPSFGPFGKLKRRLAEPIIYKQLHYERRVFDKLFSGLTPKLKEREEVLESMNSSFNKMMAHDQTAYLSSLLERQDRMSMSESVESRVPFCNPKLFDLINPVALSQKISGGVTKSIFKKISEKKLPYDLLYRRKRGLTLPVDDWLRSGKMNERVAFLTDSKAKTRGFYNHKELVKIIDLHMAQKGNYGKYIFNLIMFETWHRQFID
ncbi:MAG: asparagine synthase (glutamine-hydrolyzing) [Oligoflexia bacterium]|nr:asparagine synthase (glutamine-hydrolyzing) [Oligoflexia bacterium]